MVERKLPVEVGAQLAAGRRAVEHPLPLRTTPVRETVNQRREVARAGPLGEHVGQDATHQRMAQRPAHLEKERRQFTPAVSIASEANAGFEGQRR